MDTIRAFRWLAWLNLGCGVLLTGAMLLAFIAGPLANSDQQSGGFAITLGLLLAGGILIAGVILHHSILHLKRPSTISALNLALNSSVMLWFVVGGILREILPHTLT